MALKMAAGLAQELGVAVDRREAWGLNCCWDPVVQGEERAKELKGGLSLAWPRGGLTQTLD